MYSAYKLNKQGNNIQPCCTLFPIWNQSVVPYPLYNCCFLTCTEVSQEAGRVVWYSHLFQNFPVYCDPHSQRLWHSQYSRNRYFFLELSCFFNDPADVGNLISGSSAFSKPSLNIWKFTVHLLLKPGLENFDHYFATMWDECNFAVVWALCGIAFLWDWNENWPSLVTHTVKNLSAMCEAWAGKIPWRWEWLPTPVFLPGESHRQRSLTGYSPWACKESDTTEYLTPTANFSGWLRSVCRFSFSAPRSFFPELDSWAGVLYSFCLEWTSSSWTTYSPAGNLPFAFFFFFNWCFIALQCCVGFCSTAKWVSYM